MQREAKDRVREVEGSECQGTASLSKVKQQINTRKYHTHTHAQIPHGVGVTPTKPNHPYNPGLTLGRVPSATPEFPYGM